MSTLSSKIDFVLFFSVNGANPNGDPLMGNLPRTDYEGYGEVSDVAIKRKIRNRFQDMGNEVFVQAQGRIDDGFQSLEERFDKMFDKKDSTEKVIEESCKKWIDVRAFGQVVTFQKRSIGIRGPVSISRGKSLDIVDVISMQITRSTNGMKSEVGKRSSDTMGTKHFVEFGLYKVCGSINCYFAEKTGFSDADAELVKQALYTMFENDMSAARPEGSMTVERLYWFTHPNKLGCASAHKIHNLVQVERSSEEMPKSFADYTIALDEKNFEHYKSKGLVVEIVDDTILEKIN
ncbi:type I-C CRISPR-associated protein Cas7/Csd2 [uncultured Veillonella sp.]|uniref:type I-C CRISPR-associated protein Cas7/Csd2 n=1 Tax=uncultured Veillonella sp. TaxID=159268 RepID=UPI00261D2876|nr:type I-C CRISPR-associated protein Cas7/Csd2 [uncultured Veillonella sp.]